MANLFGGLSESYDKIRLGIDNRRLSSLLIALLRHTGPVTLTKAEAERVAEDGVSLKYESHPDGSVTLSLQDPH